MKNILDILNIKGVHCQLAQMLEPSIEDMGMTRTVNMMYDLLSENDVLRKKRQYKPGKVPFLYQHLLNFYRKPIFFEDDDLPYTLLAFRPIYDQKNYDANSIDWDDSHQDIIHFVGDHMGRSITKPCIAAAESQDIMVGYKNIWSKSWMHDLGAPFSLHMGQKVVSAFTGELYRLDYVNQRIKLLPMVEVGFASPKSFLGFSRQGTILQP